MKYFIFILGLLTFMISCTPPVVFDKAYPVGEDDLYQFPVEYQGAFICESDSSIIVIDQSTIYNRKERFFRLPLKDVEEKENCMIVEDKMFVDNRKECIPIVFESDSTVRGTVIEVDTIFNISEESVVRLYNGHLVLSQKMDLDKWSVNLLTLQDNSDVMYRAITDKTEIRSVSSTTPTEKLESKRRNAPKYRVKPTMAEFDKLINNEKIFVDCDYLKRVNLEQNFLFIN